MKEEGLLYFNRIMEALKKHHEFFQTAIPLIASENVPSPAVRAALASDFGNRYAEGYPGERLYAGCRWIDEVELLGVELAKKIFRAPFADLRPISGVVANLAAYTVLAEPGDVMVALAIPHGGHISHGKKSWNGTAGRVRGLDVVRYEFDYERFNIDVDGTRRRLEKDGGVKPKIFMLGASVFLFPHPVREVAQLAAEYGASVVYDAAHVAGLIAGGVFQAPLDEGADVMTMSTHKTLAGPQHGMVVSTEKYAEQLKAVMFPPLHSNHHLHAVAGVAIALAEAMAFYHEYTRAIVKNAKALAAALHEEGLSPLYEKYGYTESHQVLVDVSRFMGGRDAELRLEEAGIVLNRNLIPKDYELKTDYRNPSGIRIGVQEVTRLGMGPSEMKEIARFISRVVVRGEDSKKIRREVAEFRKNYTKVHYAFSNVTEAYHFIEIK
ncbi:MAG: serine hydroxymethyltransferase [Nitrososphaerota archaeon]|nr:serine hydroxymethyltransferase [Candidatus Calditenuaceae archaeon]MDW8073517.1 serine hydroxymethyltransferase [Nitrososphaerota archaeon]